MKAFLAVLAFILIGIPAVAATTNTTITLEDAFRAALDNNEEAQLADVAVRQTALLPWRAFSMVLPDVRATGSRVYPEEEVSFDSTVVIPDQEDRAALRVSQPLFDPDAIAAYRGSRYVTRSAEAQRLFRLRELLFQVAESYFNYLRFSELHAVAQETLRLAREQLRVTRERFLAGEVPRTDLLRAEVELSRAERDVETSQNNIRLAQSAFATLTGLPDRNFDAKPPPAFDRVALENDQDLEQAIVAALDMRDDLTAAINDEQAAKWVLRRAQLSLLPRVDLNFEQSWVDPTSFSQPGSFWTATLSAELPIFEGGQRLLDIREARLGLEEAQLGIERLRKAIRLQVTESWLLARSAAANLASFETERELAMENYDVTKQRYEAGQATSLDLIDAFTELARARASVVTQEFDHNLLMLRLLRDIGVFAEPYIGDRR